MCIFFDFRKWELLWFTLPSPSAFNIHISLYWRLPNSRNYIVVHLLISITMSVSSTYMNLQYTQTFICIDRIGELFKWNRFFSALYRYHFNLLDCNYIRFFLNWIDSTNSLLWAAFTYSIELYTFLHWHMPDAHSLTPF